MHLAVRFCQCSVSRDERGIQRFGKGQISGVISRQAVPHVPDAGEQDVMRIARERKIDEIGESFGAPFSGDDAGAHISAQDLRDLKIDQMRGVQRLVRDEDDAVYTPSGRRL